MIRELSTPIQHPAFVIPCHSLREKFFISFCCLLGEGRKRICMLTMIFISLPVCLLPWKNFFVVFD